MSTNKLTQEIVIKRFIAFHGDKYDYSKTVFVRIRDKITVTCPKHGDFYPTADNHFRGGGCWACYNENRKPKNVDQIEKINLVIKLHNEGFPNVKIAEETGLNVKTVKKHIFDVTGKRTPNGRKNTALLTHEGLESMCNDRLTMSVGDVAKKWGYSERHINKLTFDSPLKPKFFDRRRIARKKANVKKTVKLKKGTRTKVEALADVGKGKAKVLSHEKVFATKVRRLEDQRSVALNDGKGTVVLVNKNDPRTNDEIRDVFANRDKKFFEDLKINNLNKSKEVKQKLNEQV